MKADDRYDSLFRWYAGKSGVDWRLLKAQARAESAFNPSARSSVGASGLSQFMERTWGEWRDGTPGIQPPPVDVVLMDPRNPEAAIRAQAAMMAWLLNAKVIRGDLRKALAAYNYGIGNVGRLIDRHGSNWLASAPKETRDYVGRIEKFHDAYRLVPVG